MIGQKKMSKQDAFQHNDHQSCTSASVLQESHVHLSYGNCRLYFFFKVKETPSDLRSRSVFVPILSLETWLHQPDTEPHRTRNREVQMTYCCSMNSSNVLSPRRITYVCLLHRLPLQFSLIIFLSGQLATKHHCHRTHLKTILNLHYLFGCSPQDHFCLQRFASSTSSLKTKKSLIYLQLLQVFLFSSKNSLLIFPNAARLPVFLQNQSQQGRPTILLPQGSSVCSWSASFRRVSRGVATSDAAFASVSVADSLSTARRHSLHGVDSHKFTVRRAQDTSSLSVFFSGGGFPRPFVSTKVGLARAGLAAAYTPAPAVCAMDCGKSDKA